MGASWCGPLAVALCAVAAHGSVLAGGLVWLDHAHLTDGLALAPLSRAHELFTAGFAGTGYYRPLMALSLSIDAALGFGPLGYHAVTLFWHALAAALVVCAGRALGLPGRVPELGGALFAVHPLGSLVAGAIAFRSEAMLTATLLGVVIGHRAGRPWAAAPCLAAAALTKETGVVLGPLFVIALELARDRLASPGRARLLAAEAGALALALGLRLGFAPGWRATWPALAVSEALGTRLSLLGRALARFVLPVRIEICDAFAVARLGAPDTWPGLLVVGGLGTRIWRRRALGLLLVLSVLPALQLVPVMRWWSPHYFYLPAAFACLLVAHAAVRAPVPVRGPLARAALLACVLIPLAAASFAHGRRFRDDLALWGPEVARQAGCREGRFYLGQVALEAGRARAAIAHFEAAVAHRRDPLSYVDQAAALQNLGVARLHAGDGEGALAAFRAALPLCEPGLECRRLVHNLAAAELGLGRAEAAVGWLADEAARADALPGSLALYAEALARVGRAAEAEEVRRRLAAPGAVAAPAAQ